jgi:general secretion pathway protein L
MTMRIVSVDIGSYSIKMLTFYLEKGGVVYESSREIVIDSDEYNIVADHIEWDLQLKLINEYLADYDEETKIIINAPSEILTTRYITLPIKNKKKANAMIPFQLEEDIPYGLAEAHFGAALFPNNQMNDALISLTRKNEFNAFFDKMQEYKIEPKVLTSEESIFDTFIRNNKEIFPPSFCILDIGHSTTKAYFYIENKLVSNQKSFIAGKSISEVISENYKIDFEEATLYKHQNCFFLTKDQYENVNENQRTFASLMDKAMMPFIHEFKRWEIGHRIHQGVGISEVFITGGSSNIKNINNYLGTELGIKVNYLDSYSQEFINSQNIDTDLKFRRKFNLANMQAVCFKYKSQLINLLNGDFSLKGQIDLPIQQSVFILNRVAAFCLLLIFSFFLERFFINRDIKAVSQSIDSIKKNPVLALTARQKRLINAQPELIKGSLDKKRNAIAQEVKLMQSSASINALSTLNQLTNIISSYDCEIIEFQSLSGSDFNAEIKAKTKDALTKVEDALRASSIQDAFVEAFPKKLTLTISGKDAK